MASGHCIAPQRTVNFLAQTQGTEKNTVKEFGLQTLQNIV